MAAPDTNSRSRWLLRGLGLILLLGVMFVLGSINVPFLEPDEPTEVMLLYLFSGVVFLAFVIYGLVLIRYLFRLYTEHRRQVLGAKFKTKMVAGALALSLLPVIALFFLSYAMLNRTLAKWFPRPLEIVRDDATSLVTYLLHEQEERAQEQATRLAEDAVLQRQLETHSLVGLRETLAGLGRAYQLPWAAVLDSDNKPVAIYREPGGPFDFQANLRDIVQPSDALAFTTHAEVSGSQFALARVRVDSSHGGRLGAVVVAVAVPKEIADAVDDIGQQSAAYESLSRERKSYRWQALLILVLITVLLLLAATWSGLQLAKEVTIPVQALAVATEEVSRGNLDYRVEIAARDELGTLVNSFNEMTRQLGESRRNLLKAEMAAAWQEVAQRIAHEIKNPLTPIQLSADRIRRYLEREPTATPEERARSREQMAQCASLIAEEVRGLKTLVDQFSRFARFPEVEPVPTQLNDVVQGALALYQDSLNGIQLSAELAPNLPLISADASLLRRVLVNLIDNATEAVAHSPTRQVLVRTRPAARGVELSVADSGSGIPPQDKKRLFLPFFSTKPNGMGLGLAIVSRVVAEHRASIRVEDNRPSGTRFVIEFPLASAGVRAR
ncbi:MAG: ATP-binding protein [Candidatus Acidiferrales bacterium]